MPDFQYVYILLSECGEHHYVGCTADLQQRLNKHNNGDVSHTSKFRPWRIQTAVAFRDVEKAAAFERYLKSHSGCPQLPCGLPHVREGRPPHRPHCNRSPWRLRTATAHHRVVRTTAAHSASTFPRSERVYPAIMPLGAISPSDPSWRADTLEGHRPDARTPAADIETISLQKIVNPWNVLLCEAAGGTTSASSALPHSASTRVC